MDTALGPFLYVLFWAVVVSVGVYLLTSLGAMLFPVSTQRWRRIREEIILSRGKEISSQTSLSEETEEEQYRKAA
jgi:hypothetical protein